MAAQMSVFSGNWVMSMRCTITVDGVSRTASRHPVDRYCAFPERPMGRAAGRAALKPATGGRRMVYGASGAIHALRFVAQDAEVVEVPGDEGFGEGSLGFIEHVALAVPPRDVSEQQLPDAGVAG